jgi:restriction endonuclease S subunit
LYYNSIDALQRLLQSRYKKRGKQEQEEEDDYKCNKVSCQITKMSNNISYLTNGLKYYCVEVTCSDGIQYGIQAYGEEPVDLYKVAHRYFDVEKNIKEGQNTMFSRNH